MSGRISIPNGIILCVTITIIRLRISRVLHHAIRAQEASQLGIVVASIIVIDTQSRIALTGEQLVSVDRASSEMKYIPRVVKQNLYLPIFNDKIGNTRKLVSVVRDKSRSIGKGN